jgi:hypothetical protein
VGIALLLAGVRAPGWQAIGVGLVVLLGTVFERWRYQSTAQQHPGGHWKSTGERFLDPSTGDPVDVLFDERSGERQYVTRKSGSGSDGSP